VTPYYQDDLVTIYHGDCREVGEGIGLAVSDIGMLLTDPPYGIDYQPARDGRVSGPARWERGSRVTGDREPFDPTHLLDWRVPTILFGANHYADRLPPSGGWLVWDKTPRGIREGFIYSHAELAWTNVLGHVEKIALEWDGASRQGEPFLHPTQKPVGLMRILIERYSKPGVVLDPYAGSGTTLVAAKQTGRRAIGIEIEERYCEIAAQRCSQEVLGLVG
jgi:DNA modification methylase